jgi:outer membrane protein
MKKLLLACLFAFASFSIASAEINVAIVDLNKAFDAYYVTKDAQARLKEKADTYQKELQGLANDYQHMSDDAQTLDRAAKDPTLSQQARDEKSKALDQKKQDMMNLGNKFQELKVQRNREGQEEVLRRHKEIMDEITKVITNYSGPQGFDLVIDKSAISALSGNFVVLYNSNRLKDITADIITLLNKSAPAGAGTAASTLPAPTPTTAPTAP